MAKDKPNQGWTKELAKTPTASPPKKTFDYKRPVNKVDNPNNMAVNSRSRQYKSAPTTKNFKTEIKKKD